MSDKKTKQKLAQDEYQKELHDDNDFLSQPPIEQTPKLKRDVEPLHADDLYDCYEGYWNGNG